VDNSLKGSNKTETLTKKTPEKFSDK